MEKKSTPFSKFWKNFPTFSKLRAKEQMEAMRKSIMENKSKDSHAVNHLDYFNKNQQNEFDQLQTQ